MNNKALFGLGVLSALLLTSQAQAHDRHVHKKASDHAPIGVMGDHNHKTGEWMLSYRFMQMDMEDNLDGTDKISNEEIAAKGFMVAPTKMTMKMHMLGAMYGATDRLTFMGMLPYKDITMDHEFVRGANNGKRFTMESQGFGDAKLSALYQLGKWGEHVLYINGGASFPTGSTDERDTNDITGAELKLAYPMQLGSGTLDLLPGVTYRGHNLGWAWGAQLNAVLRTGENDDGYTLGNEVDASSWVTKNLSDNVSASFRLNARYWADIDGSDSEFNENLAPTFRADLRGGYRLDGLIGVNAMVPKGAFKGHRFSAEFGLPIVQDLDGPQLQTDYRLILGWQKSF